ncbi:MAG: hypothetical protein EZS28_033651, partial [Streblomastix strix]
PPREYPGQELHTHIPNLLLTIASLIQRLEQQVNQRLEQENKNEEQKKLNINQGINTQLNKQDLSSQVWGQKMSEHLRFEQVQAPVLFFMKPEQKKEQGLFNQTNNFNQSNTSSDGKVSSASDWNDGSRMIQQFNGDIDMEDGTEQLEEQLMEEDMKQLNEDAPPIIQEIDYMNEQQKIEFQSGKKQASEIIMIPDDTKERKKREGKQKQRDEESSDEEDEDQEEDDDHNLDDFADYEDDNLDTLPLRDVDISVATFEAFSSFCSADGDAQFATLLDSLILPARQTLQKAITQGRQILQQK